MSIYAMLARINRKYGTTIIMSLSDASSHSDGYNNHNISNQRFNRATDISNDNINSNNGSSSSHNHSVSINSSSKQKPTNHHSLLNYFSQVCLLSRGRLLYHGPTTEVGRYFRALGYRQAEYVSVMDYLVHTVANTQVKVHTSFICICRVHRSTHIYI